MATITYLNGHTGEVYNTYHEAYTAFKSGDRVCTWNNILKRYYDWTTRKFYTLKEWYEIIDEYIRQEAMCN